MNEAFLAASFASACCLVVNFANSLRSFLTKYSSSCAYSRSSHLFAPAVFPILPLLFMLTSFLAT